MSYHSSIMALQAKQTCKEEFLCVKEQLQLDNIIVLTSIYLSVNCEVASHTRKRLIELEREEYPNVRRPHERCNFKGGTP